ncbi:MAG: glycosyltransferase family 1 protein [bacterium]
MRQNLHIGVDARVLAERHTGVATYTRLLLRHLLTVRKDARLTLFSHRPIDSDVLAAIDVSGRTSVCCRRCPPAMLARPVWDHALLPMAVASREPHLFFSPLSVVPRFVRTPRVVTVHDLGFLRFPGIQPAKYRWYWQAALRRAVRVADSLIAVSHSTARDAIELLGADLERITVIHEAVDPFFLDEPTPEEESRILTRLNLEPGYILAVGTLEPRKNYETVFQVLERLRAHRPALRLVIVGAAGWLCEEVVRTIRSNSDHIQWLDAADNHTLRALYRNASIFLFPSLYEGFGLPVLEAMACGTPVVTSDAGSLPEIGGGAAIHVPACDPDKISEAVLNLLDNENLREDYRRRGHEQVRRFSWESAARKTWEVFDRVLQEA